MKELSLNILDITENSVKAGASLTEITVTEDEELLTLSIVDDGCGMDEETVRAVTDPFYTTRTTRKVGLGVPLLKMEAEQTGGEMTVTSQKGENHGTRVTATFYKNHLDFTPLGDTVATVVTLLQGHPDTDFVFRHEKNGREVVLDTREMRQMLEGVPLNEPEVLTWAGEYLREQYADLG